MNGGLFNHSEHLSSCALCCLQVFAAGYAIRDASTPELSGLEPTDEGGIEER
jgi:hypothetical protein